MDQTISYRVLRSNRKTAAIVITGEGEVLVRCPKRMPTREIQRFVEEKASWILSHLSKIQDRPRLPFFSESELLELSDRAKRIIPGKVAKFASSMDISYGRITIRKQKSRWGSCSDAGNLNFNCLLMLCPEEVLDYVIIHELCHRKEMNHSPAFWQLVSQFDPEYLLHRRRLKEEGATLIARLPK